LPYTIEYTVREGGTHYSSIAHMMKLHAHTEAEAAQSFISCGYGDTAMNEYVTTDALRVSKAAGRFKG